MRRTDHTSTDREEWDDRLHPINEDIAFQRRTWRVQRVGWFVLAIFVLAAAVGLFSEGPLSRTTATGDRLNIVYERFQRYAAATGLRVTMTPRAGAADMSLRIGRDFLDDFTIERMNPQASAARPDSGGIVFLFPAPSVGAATVYLGVRPKGIGLNRSTFALDDTDAVMLTQLIYP